LSSSSSSSSSDAVKKLAIPTITDENSHILLHPADDPSRPILIDAFAPWCGPCKLLDKVLRKSRPKYADVVDFCRWNVNDVEGTARMRQSLIDRGYVLNKLPSLVIYRDGIPVAMRPGFCNEHQLDDFLERTLPDVLERTFDEYGAKMIPMTTTMGAMAEKEEEETTTTTTTATTVTATMTTCLVVEEDCTVAENDVAREERICEIVVVETACDSESDALVSAVAVVAAAGGTGEEEGGGGTLSDCINERECYERLEMTVWKDRTVVPAMDGIGNFLPSRVKG
jgi:thioredoxin 1